MSSEVPEAGSFVEFLDDGQVSATVVAAGDTDVLELTVEAEASAIEVPTAEWLEIDDGRGPQGLPGTVDPVFLQGVADAQAARTGAEAAAATATTKAGSIPAMPVLATNYLKASRMTKAPNAVDGWVAVSSSNENLPTAGPTGGQALRMYGGAVGSARAERQGEVLSPGDYVYRVWYKVVVGNGGTGSGATQITRVSDNLVLGTTLSTDFFASPTTAWAELVMPFTVPAGGDQEIRIRHYQSTGEVLFANPSIRKASDDDRPFFNGDTIGARWTGTPGMSTSELLMVRSDDRVLGGQKVPTFSATQRNLFAEPKANIPSRWSNSNNSTGTVGAPASGESGTRLEITAAGSTTQWCTRVIVTPIGDKAQHVYVSLEVRTNQSAITIQSAFQTSGGSTIQNNSATIPTTPGQKWRRVSASIPSPANAAQLANLQVVIVGTAGAYVEFRNIMLDTKPLPAEYFDGDTLGARWVGPQNASASEIISPRASDVMSGAGVSPPVIARNLFVNPFPRYLYNVGWGENPGSAGGVTGAATVTYQVDNGSPTIAGRRVSYRRMTWTAAPGAGASSTGQYAGAGALATLSNTQGILAGASYRFGYLLRLNHVRTIRTYVSWLDANGATIGAATTFETTVSANVWTWIESAVLTAPTGAVAVLVMAYNGGNADPYQVGHTHEMTGVMIVECPNGENLPAPFDGYTPGARWTSTPHESPSELLLARAEDDFDKRIGSRQPGAMLLAGSSGRVGGWRASSTLRLEGTGSPEGAVAAPVGSEYTDLAATNGAIKWIKATGTGTTGWRVTEGDTGWRDISAFVEPEWTTSELLISRCNERVYLRGYLTRAIAGASRTGHSNIFSFFPNLGSVLSEWQKWSPRATGAVGIAQQSASVASINYSWPSIGVRHSAGGTWSVGDPLLFEVSWSATNRNWPNSLPGTAI